VDGTGRRREAFDEVADLYDRARPSYPPALVGDLAQLAGLGPGSRVLEIGCGTGQLTAGLAALGVTLVAVELGPRLAEVARRNLAGFPAVEVVTADFESWPLPAVPFDLVVSATAFHWLDPAVRVPKSAAALRRGGSLAVIETHHVAGGTPGFFDRSQDCYVRWEPATEPGFRQPVADELDPRRPELDDSPLLGTVALRRYPRDIQHTAGSLTDVLRTYSNVLGLSPENRDGLLSCLTALIDGDFDGRVTTSILNELRVAATV
jgi:protein-L-isoaspartate O-methyltransferase